MACHVTLLLVAVATAVIMRPASAATCAGEKFPAGKTYASCKDLPSLGASIHYTYDAEKSSLSVAFVAAPASSSGGWVAWGLNPTAEGMAGTQALVALKSGGGSSAPVVKTYNITGYVPLGGASTPIAFPATELAADEVGGKIRLFGKLQLHKGMKSVNQVWQVGSSVTGGAPDKHAFAAANLASKAKLVLAGGKAAAASSPAGEPAAAPIAGGPSPSAAGAGGGGAGSDSSSAVAPSAGKNAAVAAGVSAPVIAVMALVGFFLAIV
uniref:DOMON domain-containing protein n=1 Tax=Leersia perrieri TaxID=77586 RepID=A0A0D9X9Z0_9ORYZ